MKNECVYIDQILGSIDKIEIFTRGMSRSLFKKDIKTQSATIMQLLLIGELAKKLSQKTKRHINLPWKDISGFRDIAVHNYFDVDLDIVWTTIVEDLQKMKNELRKFTRT